MNPISLLTGSLQLAEAVTQAGFGLQHLQQEFGGALEHVDTIAQQTGCIDVAIREICSWLCRSSSDNLSSAFVNPLRECIDAVDETIRQIQDHCQYVKSEAEKSPIKGRLLHMSRTGKVLQWNRNLGAQIQVLMLMLHVVKLCVPSFLPSRCSPDPID